jgi:aryl-alcohol dehydrogenase-like predicted oxidoreductase
MQFRTLGRTGWRVSEVGYGTWGMGSWTGSDDTESIGSLQRAVELGCNFFDTAWAYGQGHSERLLGKLVRIYPGRRLYTATKIPPKNSTWGRSEPLLRYGLGLMPPAWRGPLRALARQARPSRRGFKLDDFFPPDHIKEYAEKSLANLGLPQIDLLQFHGWEDAWAHDERWQRAMDDLKRQALIQAVGISVNQPDNVLETLKTGQIDAVQVVYNIFEQAPEDALFPLCRELNIGVIARLPFDEGTLTGTLTKETRWPVGDFRNHYFTPEKLAASVDRAEALRPLVPKGMTMPELALRWILAEATVSTVIPGMRKIKHVEANLGVSDGQPLDPWLLKSLKVHRWDRSPTS